MPDRAAPLVPTRPAVDGADRASRSGDGPPAAVAAPGRPSLLARLDPATVALIAVAFAAAFYGLGAKGLWTDEAFSANYARLGASGLWHVVSRTDPNMSLYYVLLHFWVLVFGSSEAAVRGLSAIAGGLAIPFAVPLGTRLFGRASGLLAGLLLALNPFFVHYEQTARAYALVVLLVLVSCYAFVAALENPSRARLLGYALATALSVYAHYFAALILLVQMLTLLAAPPPREQRRRWALAVGAVIVLCLPAAVFASRAGTQGLTWIGRPTLHDLTHFPLSLAGGSVLAGLLILLACYGLVRALAAGRRWQAGFALAWLIVPVAVDFVASELGRPLFVVYYLIVTLPALLLLGANGAVALPRRVLIAGACVLLVAVSLIYTRSWYRESSVEGFRGATHHILVATRRSDDLVDYPELRLGGPAAGIAYYESRAPAGEPRPEQVTLAYAQRALAPRVWLVMRNSDLSVRRRDEVEQMLARRYVAVERQTHYRNLTVVLYRRS